MNDRVKLFKELLLNESLTPEMIYQAVYESRPEDFSTKKINRGLYNWKNCIYQGTIGENDFVIAESSLTSLDEDNNVAMIYDDYKKTMISFIEGFREKVRQNPDDSMFLLLWDFSVDFAKTAFEKAGRSGKEIRKQRNDISQYDEDMHLKKFNISEQRGEERDAVCCERNSTIGNAFQLAGFDTYQVSGILDYGKSWENHFFTLVKNDDEHSYFVIDAFNESQIPNALPEDYNLSNGFDVDTVHPKTNIPLHYSVSGPLHEMTREMLKTEAKIRLLTKFVKMYENTKSKDPKILEALEKLEKGADNLLNRINNLEAEDVFKERCTKYVNVLKDDIIKKKSELSGIER